MRCLLAVDAGGTKCDAVLVDEAGHILGTGRRDCKPGAAVSHIEGFGRSAQAIGEAVAEAILNLPHGSELLVAGRRPPDNPSTRELFASATYHNVREQDAPMAIVGASAGIVILAGTGAFVYGKAPSGEEALLDALGPLFGDHGSAFQIGLAACRAVGCASWHPCMNTTLREVIPIACRIMAGAPNDFSMVRFMLEPHDRAQIASLARLVDDAAEAGDRISTDILINAADDIAETARCVVERLGLPTSDLPLIGSGGVAVSSKIYWRRVVERINEIAPHMTPTLINQPAVFGLILGMASQMGFCTPSFRSTLLG